ncbi:Transposon Ty3-G Gag-Pol polyprotein, partial [Stegodyphus mimosarum]
MKEENDASRDVLEEVKVPELNMEDEAVMKLVNIDSKEVVRLQQSDKELSKIIQEVKEAMYIPSKYPNAVAVTDISSPSVIDAFLQIFSRMGFSKVIQTDQGISFVSALTVEFLERFGIKHVRSSVYHPHSNPVERFHRTLKRVLRVVCILATSDWEKYLPSVLFALRTITYESTGFKPAELVHGKNLRTPVILLYEQWLEPTEERNNVVSYVFELINRMKKYQELAVEKMKEAQQRKKTWYDRNVVKTEFVRGDLVLVLITNRQNKLEVQWKGPGKIEQKISETNYVVNFEKQNEANQVYHINMLKPYYKRPEMISMITEVEESSSKDPRPCIDYRKLNAVTKTEYYPLPNIEECIQTVGKAKYITLLNLSRGYCKVMTKVLAGREGFAVPYLDDTAIYSENWEEHLKNLTSVLDRTQKANLRLKPSKCKFARDQVRYVGHVVGEGQRTPDEVKILAVKECPAPKTKKEAHLGGSALNTVEGFPISGDAYGKAVQLLKDRFGNPEILIQAHMNKILSMQSLKYSNDIKSFRKFVDNCNVQLRSLESLNVSPKHYSSILCPMLLKLIPTNLVLEYNKSQENKSGSDIQRLLSFLTLALTAREQTYSNNKSSLGLNDRKQDSKHNFPRDKNLNKKQNLTDAPTANELLKASTPVGCNMEKKKTICVFCDSVTHTSDCCNAVMNLTLEERKNSLLRKGACFNCLQKAKHLSRNCPIKKTKCEFCSGLHHKFVCFEQQKKEIKNNMDSESTDLTNQSKGQVFLQTLTVYIEIKISRQLVRAIIDTGSQKSYISKCVAKTMGLKSRGKETITHGLFGDNCVTSVDSLAELESFQRDTEELLAMGKFDLRGWLQYEVCGQAFERKIEHQKSYLPEVQVLGLAWNLEEDSLSDTYRKTETKGEFITKRKFLSLAHRIFDPIGVTCSVTLIPKLLLQE